VWNIGNAAVNPKHGVDPGQKFQVYMAKNSPHTVYQENPQQPELRQAIRDNKKVVRGRFYRKLNLTSSWEQKYANILRQQIPGIGQTLQQLIDQLRGSRSLLAGNRPTFSNFMLIQSRFRALLRPHFQRLFYRKQGLIRSTAQRRSLRVMGNYMSGKIDVFPIL
jgi:hypothetical protein